MVVLYSLKMKLYTIGCVVIGYFVHVLIANQKGCSFRAHGPNEKYSPLIFQNETIIMPKNGRIYLRNKQVVTLLCPDPRNYLIKCKRENFQRSLETNVIDYCVLAKSNTTHAQCIGGKVLRLAKDDFNFEDLKCKHIIKGTVSTTSRRCGNYHGQIYKIGYPLNPRFFFTLIEVCYNVENGTTLYTEHLLHGQDIKYASKSSYRPSFSPEAATYAVAVAYKQAFQKATFNKLFKSALIAQKYINEFSFLARGHLSPDADFLFAATQYTTYYYINAMPQWQAMNAGNWLRIEGMVRKVADYLKESLLIYTGTYDVLTLPGAKGNFSKMYLIYGNKLPVPKFFWKIVYSKKSQEAMVLIALNNPFVEVTDRGDSFLCKKNVCKQTGWNTNSWLDYSHGLVHCCDYREFIVRVETAPKLAVFGLLRGPKSD